MKWLILMVAFTSCATWNVSEVPPAFAPPFSLRELEYVVASLDRYLADSTPCTKESAKALVLETGGWKSVPLNVELPDQSSLQVKLTSKGSPLISGYDTTDGRWLVISAPKDGGYPVSIGPRGGVGGYACFKVSLRGSKVSDEGVLIACP